MTRLESEMKSAIINSRINLGNTTDHAKACAEVARKYIEKALRDSTLETFTGSAGLMTKVQDLFVSEWLKENGVI